MMTGVFVLFLAVTLLLGLMHESLLAGEVSIVFVQRFKREAGELAEVGRRLKKELTSWDDAQEKPPPSKPVPQPKEQGGDRQ
jgi:hypothetical protein